MSAYLEQHHGQFILGKRCDVCYVDKMSDDYGLVQWLTKADTALGGYSHILPNLCSDHGRELGVVW